MQNGFYNYILRWLFWFKDFLWHVGLRSLKGADRNSNLIRILLNEANIYSWATSWVFWVCAEQKSAVCTQPWLWKEENCEMSQTEARSTIPANQKRERFMLMNSTGKGRGHRVWDIAYSVLTCVTCVHEFGGIGWRFWRCTEGSYIFVLLFKYHQSLCQNWWVPLQWLMRSYIIQNKYLLRVAPVGFSPLAEERALCALCSSCFNFHANPTIDTIMHHALDHCFNWASLEFKSYLTLLNH